MEPSGEAIRGLSLIVDEDAIDSESLRRELKFIVVVVERHLMEAIPSLSLIVEEDVIVESLRRVEI